MAIDGSPMLRGSGLVITKEIERKLRDLASHLHSQSSLVRSHPPVFDAVAVNLAVRLYSREGTLLTVASPSMFLPSVEPR